MNEKKYYKLKAGKKIWSIDLQALIMFDSDIILTPTNSIHNSDGIFARRCIVLYDYPGMIPGVMETRNEFSTSKKDLEDYEIPEPYGFDWE